MDNMIQKLFIYVNDVIWIELLKWLCLKVMS
jgi:hypothetical protein